MFKKLQQSLVVIVTFKQKVQKEVSKQIKFFF